MAGTVGLLALGKHAHGLARIGGLRVLSPHQDAIVIAASDRIIPATDTPGAAGVHVDRFIDTMLAEWYTPAEQRRFLAGLANLDDERFLERTPTEQMAIIDGLDRDATEGHWFAMLKYLTIWGYYTSEVAERALGNWPLAGHFDGNAPYAH